MASFEDVNRIVNAPLGSMGEIDRFVPKPAIPDQPLTFDERSIGIGELYAREVTDALDKSSWGVVDLALSAKAVVAGTFLGAMQDDYKKMIARGETLLNPDGVLDQLVTASVDWKAVALASGVYALASGARRARRPFTIGTDMRKTAEKAREAGAEIIPHTERTYRSFRRMRAVKQAVGTVAATGAAYGAGKYLSLETDLVGGMAFASVGMVSALGAKRRFMRRYAH